MKEAVVRIMAEYGFHVSAFHKPY